MNAGEPSTLQQFRKINARSQTQHRVDRGAFRARTVTAVGGRRNFRWHPGQVIHAAVAFDCHS